MATTNTITESTSTPSHSNASLLVLFPAYQESQLQGALRLLAESLPPDELLIATPEPPSGNAHPAFNFVAAPPSKPSWTLTANDFVHAFQLAQKSNVRGILLLGAEFESLRSAGLRDLGNTVLLNSTDLAIPCYDLPPRAGLVNSAVFYPLSRALFASRIRFPLAIDLGLSMRMAERLAGIAQRFVAANQGDAPIWPVNEATALGFNIEEVDVGSRQLPQPIEPDLNSVLPFVTGSLFSDIDAKAAFWQRVRVTPPARKSLPIAQTAPVDATAEVAALLQGFRLAYSNLQDIWSLVLPPNSLIGLKRLSQIDGSAFRMPESLWVRIVFDFLVAYRLRTINRGHLLGALIPLYLAWVASHINTIAAGTNPERHVEALAAAFEADKAYLVARWRWPDRFNP